MDEDENGIASSDVLTLLEVDEESVVRALIESTADSMGPGGALAKVLYRRLSNNELARQENLTEDKTAQLRQTIRAELALFGDRLAERLADIILSRVQEIARSGGVQTPSITCVLLCGGPSRRLWPVTRTMPKVLLPLANESVLEHVLTQVECSRHVSSVILSTDPRSDPHHIMIEDLIRARYPPGSAKIPRILPDAKKGIGPLAALRDIAASCDGDLLVVGGDNIFHPEFNFDGLIEAARVDGLAGAVGVVPNSDARYDIRFLGQVEIDSSDYVLRLLEKERVKRFEYVSAACYLLKRSHLAELKTYINIEQKYALGDYLNWIVGQPQLPRLVAFPIPQAWFDMGDVGTYLEASRHYLTHQRTSGSRRKLTGGPPILEPCSLMADPGEIGAARSIGPFVYLDQDVVIKNSRVSNSVVLRGAVLNDADVRNALIGPGAEINGVFENGVCGANACIVGPYPEWEAPTAFGPHSPGDEGLSTDRE